MNIVDVVKSALGGDVMDSLASYLNVGQSQTRSAVNAAVPGLLAGISSIASTPEGARKLNNIVDQQDEGVLNNFGASIGNRGASMVQQGSSALNSLAGDGFMSGIKNALGKFTGLGGGAISSLIGLLAPVIFGVLRKQKTSMGLDSAGLANLLGGQKQNIMNAMPAGLAGALGGIPGLSNVLGPARETVETGTGYARDAYSSAREPVSSRAYTSTRPTASAPHRPMPAWVKWALPLLAIALLVWGISWFTNRPPQAAPAPRTVTPPQTTVPAAPTYSISSVTNEFNSLFDSATESLKNVTDVESAQRAVPKIDALNTHLDKMRVTWNQMEAGDHQIVSNLMTSSQTKLQPVLDRVMAIPGVSPVLKPHVDTLMQKLGGFGTS